MTFCFYKAIHIGNQPVWYYYRLELKAMHPFVSTVDEFLVNRRSTYWPYSPVYEAPAMLKRPADIRYRICVLSQVSLIQPTLIQIT